MARLALSIIHAAFIVVLSVYFVFTSDPTSQAASGNNVPAYVSSTACAKCHQKEYSAWSASHHSWALRLPTSENVLGDFNGAVFVHQGNQSRFFTRNDRFFIETDGRDGKTAEFEVKYTVGVEPLQQYLVETDKGRLQALDIAWDTEKKRWFHLYPEQNIKPGDGIHWSGPYKNWNSRCAECHQTDFKKNYSPKSASYQSRWSELTIGCEACHGPGSAHIQWAKNPETFKSQKPTGVDEKGLTVTLPFQNANEEIETCARCHSRRSPLGPDSPPPGAKFSDHYRLALLRNGLYHADGQINDEVYVYGSFLQSKMYARGVRCSNCHDPHSGKLVAEGNDVCTQCHNPAGNTKFQTLKKATYDSTSHHHHKVGSEGARCVNCHMPAKNFMQVDPRRDHSFRVPRPDLSAKVGAPNACVSCHQDKTSTWAAATLKKWFPDGRTGTSHYGEILHAGRNQPGTETADKLIDLALDTQKPAIVRASALNMLDRSISPQVLARISVLLKDKDTHIRQAAAQLFGHARASEKSANIVPLLSDPAKTVRLEAARLTMGASLDGLPEKDQAAARNAISAYQNSLLARADFPETQMQIAGMAMYLKNFKAAQKALETAVSMDPQLAVAWLTLVRIQLALQQPGRALNTLERAVKKVPDNATVQLQLGELYTRSRQHDRAIIALEQSQKLSGDSPVLMDLLAVNYLASGNLEKARIYANRLIKEYPGHQPSSLVRQILKIPKNN